MLKKVGCAIYAHESNKKEFIQNVLDEDRKEIENILEECRNNFDLPYRYYTVMKYDKVRHTLSLIQCWDWFSAWEPTVGNSWCFNLQTGICTERKYNPKNLQIYHSPWMFMANDYPDKIWIEASKMRTQVWNSIPNIGSLKSKIGYKNFWVQLLKENKVPIEMKPKCALINIQFMGDEEKRINKYGETIYIPDYPSLILNAADLEEVKMIKDTKGLFERLDDGFRFEIIYTISDHTYRQDMTTWQSIPGKEWTIYQHPWYVSAMGHKHSKEAMITEIVKQHCNKVIK